jgi:hypothetical protein
MTIDDAPHLKAIADLSKRDDYRLGTIVRNLAASPLFQLRVADEPSALAGGHACGMTAGELDGVFWLAGKPHP